MEDTCGWACVVKWWLLRLVFVVVFRPGFTSVSTHAEFFLKNLKKYLAIENQLLHKVTIQLFSFSMFNTLNKNNTHISHTFAHLLLLLQRAESEKKARE